ncbi:hypothetical protein [Bradyrhizobium sp. 191]|nr:hypothetical protein [Bradyrhizobium sp. 191]UPJ67823.1 hypothetical protein IVB23_10870 [Bradyrhizobium sp. 191]
MVAGLLRGRNARGVIDCEFVAALSPEGLGPPLLTIVTVALQIASARGW